MMAVGISVDKSRWISSKYEKPVEGESGRKREKTSRKYASSEDVYRWKGSRKDCA